MDREHLDKLAGIRTLTIPVTGAIRFIKKLFGGKDDEQKERYKDEIMDKFTNSLDR